MTSLILYTQDGKLVFDSSKTPAVIGTEDEVRRVLAEVVDDPAFKGGTLTVYDAKGRVIVTASKSGGVTFHPAAHAKE